MYSPASTPPSGKERDHMPLFAGDEAQLLYNSLEQFDRERTRRRWSSLNLAALLVLFMSSAGGITLAVILMLKPVGVQGADLPRDLIVFAAGISLLYIGFHLIGALRSKRSLPSHMGETGGPPQIYGNYIHAGALLIARLSIGVWIASLVATTIMTIKAVPLGPWTTRLPFLDLLICVGGLTSLVVISCTIEKNPTPFATAGISRTSLLTCQVSEFADNLTADMSVSRRGSLSHADNKERYSAASLGTAEVVRIMKNTPKPRLTDSNSKLDTTTTSKGKTATNLKSTTSSSNASMGIESKAVPFPSHTPPQPVYYPDSWRREWNKVGRMVDIPALTECSSSTSTRAPSAYSSSHYSGTSDISSQTSCPSTASRKYRPTPSTSIPSLAQRSGLSIVRYAEKPEVALQPVLRVVRNHSRASSYSPATDVENYVTQLRPASLRRGQKQAQRSRAQTWTESGPRLQRRPSNFSRPIPEDRTGETRTPDSLARGRKLVKTTNWASY